MTPSAGRAFIVGSAILLALLVGVLVGMRDVGELQDVALAFIWLLGAGFVVLVVAVSGTGARHG